MSLTATVPTISDENALKQRLHELENENARLVEENKRLRAQLKSPPSTKSILGAHSPNIPDETSLDRSIAAESVKETPPMMQRLTPVPSTPVRESTIESSPEAPNNNNTPEEDTQNVEASTDQTPEDDMMASIRLAQQLMQEEEERRLQEWQQAAMRQSLMMHESNHAESDTDLALAVQLQRQESALAGAVPGEGDIVDEEGVIQEEEMTYDEMLQLGDQIGDVKKEQWRMKAPKYVNALPQHIYVPPSISEASEASTISSSCLICTCDYEEGEKIKELPCGHCYHTECIDKWLLENNSCPVCKRAIYTSPNKNNAATRSDTSPSAASVQTPPVPSNNSVTNTE